MLVAVALFMVYLPRTAEDMLGQNYYREWLNGDKPEYSGVITVWHVVGFKPHLGSIGNWMKALVRPVEKRHFGVYFEIESISTEEAERRIAGGEFPDMISFPHGWCGGDRLKILDGDFPVDVSSGMDMSLLRAVPFAASCKLILYRPSQVDAEALKSEPELAAQYDFDSFKADKSPCCITDARGAGDMDRAVAAGKASYFEVLPIFEETDLVQYIGIGADCESEKLKYIYDLMDAMLSKKNQSELCELGLMPLLPDAEQKYAQPYLQQAYSLIVGNDKGIENTFDRWIGLHDKSAALPPPFTSAAVYRLGFLL